MGTALHRCILVSVILVSAYILFCKKKTVAAASPGGLEPPTFRLTAERADRLRHGDLYEIFTNSEHDESDNHVPVIKKINLC